VSKRDIFPGDLVKLRPSATDDVGGAWLIREAPKHKTGLRWRWPPSGRIEHFDLAVVLAIIEGKSREDTEALVLVSRTCTIGWIFVYDLTLISVT
jgi:hypothetical protein